MRAYDLAMMQIFICCSFPIIEAMGITVGVSSNMGELTIFNALYMTLFTVAGVSINPMIILAGLMAAGTIIVVGTNMITDRGLAMTTFALVFWGSFGLASITLKDIIFHFPGFIIFWTIYLLASGLIFVNALVQFPTGGQGAHV
jgi:hypothetical protein